MAGALGERYLVKINDTTVSPQTYTTIECQGDATLNTGKSLEISRTKNCKHPFFRESGYTLAVQIELENPMSTIQGDLLDAGDNETELEVQFISTDTGMPKWEGQAFFAYDPFTTPTEGIVTIDGVFAFVNDPTRGLSA